MKFAEKSLQFVLGALLMAAAANSLALSLGRMRGVAIVGRPLDATLPVQLDASEGLASVCATADVFFGDSQVPVSKVRIATSAGPGAAEALIRIRTTSVVDEPVVTFYVQEGCQYKNARKYVMLAEALADNTVPQLSNSAPVVVQPPVVPGGRDARGIAAAGRAGVGPSEAGAPPSARKASKAKPQTGLGSADSVPPGSAQASALAPVSSVRQARKPVSEALAASRSRLKLDPIDLSIDRDPVLRSSPELLTAPSADPGQRAAAAALWQALNAQPQDMARDSQRLKSLEADVAGMLAQGRKTETAITDLRGQLEQARGERYANGLVYALGGFLVLALAIAGFLGMRSRRHKLGLGHGPWWGEEAVGGKRGVESGFATSAVSALQPSATGHAENVSSPPDSVVDISVDEPHSENLRNKPMPKSATPPRRPESREYPEFLPSMGGLSGMPRIVNAEELFDVQQQADFFLSLGNADKAVEVLLHHIMDNVETSALVYLDLFDLYHSLGRRDDYDALRKDFHRMFNAQVPAFDDYTMDSHGLEFYVAAWTRIESLWPTPKVLDVLEESIFRKPDSRSEVFSLAAYRELLLLHSIAKKIIAPPLHPVAPASSALNTSVGLPPASSFGPTSIQPLSAQLQDTPPPLPITLPVADFAVSHAALSGARPVDGIAAPDLTRPPVSSRLGLDIDLSLDEQEALVPLPSIAELDEPSFAENKSNLIEFDLDGPVSNAPTQKV
jgi:hypothetical protein